MKPALAIVHRDLKPSNVSPDDGVTLRVRRSEDPERLARLLDLLQAMLDEQRESKP